MSPDLFGFAGIGRMIRLDNDAYTIAGILPQGFRHPGKTVADDPVTALPEG